MKYCTNCGNGLSDDAAFCPSCGAKQGGDPAPEEQKSDQPLNKYTAQTNKEKNTVQAQKEEAESEKQNRYEFYPKRKTLIQTLYEREMFSGILWTIVGIWQIVAGIEYFIDAAVVNMIQMHPVMLVIDGILFIVFGIINLTLANGGIKTAQIIKSVETGNARYRYGLSIVDPYRKTGWDTLVYNIVIWVLCLLAQSPLPILAGSLGVIASAYYILGIHNFVVYNEAEFRKIEDRLAKR